MPNLRFSAELRLQELTTAEIWSRMHVQVVKVTSGVDSTPTFVIHDRLASMLGESFGGPGVTSIVVTDIAHAGRPVLLFTYSFGSGIARSRVGSLDRRCNNHRQ